MNNNNEIQTTELLTVRNRLVANQKNFFKKSEKLSQLMDELNHISDLLNLDISDEDSRAIAVRQDEIRQNLLLIEEDVSRIKESLLYDVTILNGLQNQLKNFN